MFHSTRLTALLALGLLAEGVIAVSASTPRSDASVSLSPCTIVLSALLNALEISWGSCDSFDVNGNSTNLGTHLGCTHLEVPMDYHNSSAGNARLAVIRLAATAKKLGTVFFNPGSSLHLSFVVSH